MVTKLNQQQQDKALELLNHYQESQGQEGVSEAPESLEGFFEYFDSDADSILSFEDAVAENASLFHDVAKFILQIDGSGGLLEDSVFEVMTSDPRRTETETVAEIGDVGSELAVFMLVDLLRQIKENPNYTQRFIPNSAENNEFRLSPKHGSEIIFKNPTSISGKFDPSTQTSSLTIQVPFVEMPIGFQGTLPLKPTDSNQPITFVFSQGSQGKISAVAQNAKASVKLLGANVEVNEIVFSDDLKIKSCVLKEPLQGTTFNQLSVPAGTTYVRENKPFNGNFVETFQPPKDASIQFGETNYSSLVVMNRSDIRSLVLTLPDGSKKAVLSSPQFGMTEFPVKQDTQGEFFIDFEVGEDKKSVVLTQLKSECEQKSKITHSQIEPILKVTKFSIVSKIGDEFSLRNIRFDESFVFKVGNQEITLPAGTMLVNQDTFEFPNGKTKILGMDVQRVFLEKDGVLLCLENRDRYFLHEKYGLATKGESTFEIPFNQQTQVTADTLAKMGIELQNPENARIQINSAGEIQGVILDVGSEITVAGYKIKVIKIVIEVPAFIDIANKQLLGSFEIFFDNKSPLDVERVSINNISPDGFRLERQIEPWLGPRINVQNMAALKRFTVQWGLISVTTAIAMGMNEAEWDPTTQHWVNGALGLPQLGYAAWFNLAPTVVSTVGGVAGFAGIYSVSRLFGVSEKHSTTAGILGGAYTGFKSFQWSMSFFSNRVTNWGLRSVLTSEVAVATAPFLLPYSFNEFSPYSYSNQSEYDDELVALNQILNQGNIRSLSIHELSDAVLKYADEDIENNRRVVLDALRILRNQKMNLTGWKEDAQNILQQYGVIDSKIQAVFYGLVAITTGEDLLEGIDVPNDPDVISGMKNNARIFIENFLPGLYPLHSQPDEKYEEKIYAFGIQ